eukprot:GHVS01061709.1.p2 GENE.GHVS01061709.1~~GHVS01061709.1.p2  ORF type:complete len:112 (-),score=20.18 GHVS01061709.1:102-437(-)
MLLQNDIIFSTTIWIGCQQFHLPNSIISHRCRQHLSHKQHTDNSSTNSISSSNHKNQHSHKLQANNSILNRTYTNSAAPFATDTLFYLRRLLLLSVRCFLSPLFNIFLLFS